MHGSAQKTDDTRPLSANKHISVSAMSWAHHLEGSATGLSRLSADKASWQTIARQLFLKTDHFITTSPKFILSAQRRMRTLQSFLMRCRCPGRAHSNVRRCRFCRPVEDCRELETVQLTAALLVLTTCDVFRSKPRD